MDALLTKRKIKAQTQESLIKHHSALVKRIAYHLKAHLPDNVLVDDLIQSGMMGLLDAIAHYDKSKGASFETYANIRIRGHMLDEVRRNDWVPRSVHRNARIIAEAVKKVENRTGRDARDHEIAAEMNLSLGDYHHLLNDASGCQVFGFDDLGVTEDVLKDLDEKVLSEPQQNALKANLKAHLRTIMDGLPAKEHLLLSLYYEHDLNLKEIGEILEVSESRVSQIHSQALLRIKSRVS